MTASQRYARFWSLRAGGNWEGGYRDPVTGEQWVHVPWEGWQNRGVRSPFVAKRRRAR